MQEQTSGIVHTITAGQDLRDAEGKAVKLDGTVAVVATVAAAIGILGTKPNSGEDGRITVAGITKAKFGAAVNSGAAYTVMASGFFGPYTAIGSGGYPPFGRVLVQVASGDYAECTANFLNGGLAV